MCIRDSYHYHADIVAGAGFGIVAVIGTHILMVGLVGAPCVSSLVVHLCAAILAVEDTC